jgi:hypothetical protein
MVAIVNVPRVEAMGNVLEEGNGDFLRRVLQEGLREIMDTEVASLFGAPPGERSVGLWLPTPPLQGRL